MIKNYLSNRKEYIEVLEIDTETGKVKQYLINTGLANCKIAFPFSFHNTTAADMGYKTPVEMLKQLKKRKNLGEEVPHDRQRAREIGTLLHLAKFRKSKKIDFSDITNVLSNNYNLSKEYSEKIIDYITNYDIERHIIKVFCENGDCFTTEINGTIEDIEKHYIEKIEFIA